MRQRHRAAGYGILTMSVDTALCPTGVRVRLGLFLPMIIAGLGTAAPAQCYTQQQCWEAVQQTQQFGELSARSRAILKKILTGQNGIRTRHLALENLNEAFELTPDALQARFVANAPLLATQAAQRALTDARVEAEAIDAVIISTC